MLAGVDEVDLLQSMRHHLRLLANDAAVMDLVLILPTHFLFVSD